MMKFIKSLASFRNIDYAIISYLKPIILNFILGYCDQHLTERIKSNRIKVGDKLAIFSAELVGCPCDGCPPLEVY